MRKFLKSLGLILVLSSLCSCDLINGEDKPHIDPKPDITINSTIDLIMEGTCYETKVYTFESSIEGPRCAIVGGIHGDEVAGWKAAEKLIEKNDYKGTVLLIPYANILADALVQRYPGQSTGGYVTSDQIKSLKQDEVFKTRDLDHIEQTKYADLNRSFPGKSNGTDTQKLAYAIYNTIIDFNPDFVVDLHESRFDHRLARQDSNYLGNTIIYGNIDSSAAAMEMCEIYNDTYLLDGEETFEYLEGTVTGSFCNTLGNALPEAFVFTIETNRKYINGRDTNPVERRTEQQLENVSVFLDYAYSYYLASK